MLMQRGSTQSKIAVNLPVCNHKKLKLGEY